MSTRSDDILRGIHKVVTHDLPNQIIAVQGLLQLFDMEQAEGLPPDGREFLKRIQQAVGRIGEQARFLKEMDRIARHIPQVERVTLAEVMGELQAILRQQRPRSVLAFESEWRVAQIPMDRKAFVQGMRELFSWLLDHVENPVHIRTASDLVGDGVEFSAVLSRLTRPGVAALASLPTRPEFVLAREWLAVAGAALRWDVPIDLVLRIVVQTPRR